MKKISKKARIKIGKNHPKINLLVSRIELKKTKQNHEITKNNNMDTQRDMFSNSSSDALF